ncbi:MAG: AMIN-like domain-containing (lipo)protein [Actinomycetota bacterium]
MRRAAVVVLALLLPACAAGQDPTVEAGGDAPAATSASTSTPASSGPGTASPVAPPISTPAVQPRSYLTAVRAAGADQPGSSRVVFEFDSVVPGYTIDYVQRPVTEDGSGDEVTVKGEAILQVRFENASGARIEGEKVIRTYNGPDRVPAAGAEGVATEVVDAGDFEGAVTWVIGLRRRAPSLSVSTLSGPARLVIDVPAP